MKPAVEQPLTLERVENALDRLVPFMEHDYGDYGNKALIGYFDILSEEADKLQAAKDTRSKAQERVKMTEGSKGNLTFSSGSSSHFRARRRTWAGRGRCAPEHSGADRHRSSQSADEFPWNAGASRPNAWVSAGVVVLQESLQGPERSVSLSLYRGKPFGNLRIASSATPTRGRALPNSPLNFTRIIGIVPGLDHQMRDPVLEHDLSRSQVADFARSSARLDDGQKDSPRLVIQFRQGGGVQELLADPLDGERWTRASCCTRSSSAQRMGWAGLFALEKKYSRRSLLCCRCLVSEEPDSRSPAGPLHPEAIKRPGSSPLISVTGLSPTTSMKLLRARSFTFFQPALWLGLIRTSSCGTIPSQ